MLDGEDRTIKAMWEVSGVLLYLLCYLFAFSFGCPSLERRPASRIPRTALRFSDHCIDSVRPCAGLGNDSRI